MTRGFRAVAVGYVRSPIREPEDAPRQGRDAGTEVRVDVLPEYRQAMRGLERWGRVVVVCWLHRARRDLLAVHPRRDGSRPAEGVFATRSPNRPNPLGVYTAELLEVRADGVSLRGVDAVDGTPVLDIRPHIPRLDG